LDDFKFFGFSTLTDCAATSRSEINTRASTLFDFDPNICGIDIGYAKQRKKRVILEMQHATM
jgi:hypothetical protein